MSPSTTPNPAPDRTEELWRHLGGRLRAYLRGQVGDDATADDLLQETFLRIHRGLAGVADDERLEPWVFRIARNLVTDLRRARGAAREDADPALAGAPEVAAADDAASDTDNLNGLVGSWLPAMVQRLPEPYREAMELHELQGLTQREVAERLGLSLSGAKSRVQRGREQLVAQLLACCSLERDRRGNVIDYARNHPAGGAGDCAC